MKTVVARIDEFNEPAGRVASVIGRDDPAGLHRCRERAATGDPGARPESPA